MSYATVDDSVRCILTSRTPIPVHPTDRLLLGLSWRACVWSTVSGRCRSSSRQWPMPYCGRSGGGISFMPCTIWRISLYLAPRTPRNVPGYSRRAFGCAIVWVSLLPRTSWKGRHPGWILIDFENDTLSLPADKCARLRSAISEWRDRKFCRKRELLSLIGQLQHACRVVRAGRTFLRRMNYLSSTSRDLDHWVQLNLGFRSDIQWWNLFLEQCARASFTVPGRRR